MQQRLIRPWQVHRRRIDVYHSLYLYQPPLRGAKCVLTVHDMIPCVMPHLVPEEYRQWFLSHMQTAKRWADRIIVYSRSTLQDVRSVIGIEEDRVSCIPLGVDQSFLEPISIEERGAVCNAYRLSAGYILYLGDFQPRKNVLRLVEAYDRAQQGRLDFPDLVLAGHSSNYKTEVRCAIDRLGLSERTHLLDEVPDSHVRGLLSAAGVFVFPSLYEGFGLPPLEAMACRTAVVASTASSLPEVVGGAALLVEPTSIEEMAAAIVKTVSDAALRMSLEHRGHARAKQLTWQRTAAATLRVYEELATVPRSTSGGRAMGWDGHCER